MLRDAGRSLPADSQVEEMDDGGMGSLRFLPSDSESRFGAQIAAAQFLDSDATLVSVAINVDQHGQLFEVDFWKVDFSPLQRIPPISDIQIST
jgi:hypothetical protein